MAPNEDSFSLACDVILFIIFAAATASNSLVLLVFYRRPGLRTLSNRFVINLLVTNLLSCWILLPLILTDSLWLVTSNGICAINQGVSAGLCTASVLSVLLIGLDQYYAVIDPLHYHSHIDNVRCAVMITASWIVSVVFGLVGGTFYDNSSIWNSCSSSQPIVPDIYLSVFCIVYSLLVFVLPFGCLCWMYVSIYTAAHKNSQRTRRNGSSAGFYTGNAVAANETPDYSIVPNPTLQQQNATIVTIQDTPSQIPSASPKSVDSPEQPVFVKTALHRSATRTSLRSTPSFLVNSLRYRISNASMFRYREETRAARISALVIVMSIICWLPFTVVLLLNSPLCNGGVPHFISKISLTLLASSAIITPLLFAHRNRKIQRDLKRILGLARRPTSVYPGQQIQRRSAQSQRNQMRVLPPNYSHNALELLGSLAEGADESAMVNETRIQEVENNTDNAETKNGTHFLTRMWCKQRASGVVPRMGKALISVPEVAIDVDTSRSSFSSGGSSVTQRSTSAASISSIADEF